MESAEALGRTTTLRLAVRHLAAGEQRARLQEAVANEAFEAESVPIAKTLALVLKLRDDLRTKRSTMKRVAAAREVNIEELREYLEPGQSSRLPSATGYSASRR